MKNFRDFFRRSEEPEPKQDFSKLSDKDLLGLETRLKIDVERELLLWDRIRAPSREALAEFLSPKGIQVHEQAVKEAGDQLVQIRKKLAAVQSVVWERGLRSGQ